MAPPRRRPSSSSTSSRSSSRATKEIAELAHALGTTQRELAVTHGNEIAVRNYVRNKADVLLVLGFAIVAYGLWVAFTAGRLKGRAA